MWNDVSAESIISHALIVFIPSDREYISFFPRFHYYNCDSLSLSFSSLLFIQSFLLIIRGHRPAAFTSFCISKLEITRPAFDAANDPAAFRKFYERRLCLNTLNDSPRNKSPNFLCACERASERTNGRATTLVCQRALLIPRWCKYVEWWNNKECEEQWKSGSLASTFLPFHPSFSRRVRWPRQIIRPASASSHSL